MIEKIKNIKLSKKQQTIIILVSIFVIMLVLNLLTPLIVDDYSYSLTKSGERINSLMDILKYQWTQYFNWGGRTIAHIIAQTFLMFPKWIFSIANTIVYIILIYLIYLHAKGKEQEDKPLMLLLIHLALWFLLPAYGQSCLWLVGSCNYLWTTVIILFFLLEFTNNASSKDSIMKIIAMLLLGVIAAWTNENTSFGVLVIIIGVLIIKKINHKKVKKWEISGFIGAILGFLILILAPGNFVRAQSFPDNTFIIVELLKRMIEYTGYMAQFALPVLILGIILITIYIYNKKKIQPESIIYIVAGFFTIYAMVLSPTFPTRAWTGVMVFWIIACAQLIYRLEDINKIFKPVIIDATLILTILYINPVLTTAKEILNLRKVWEYRADYIAKEKAKGNKNIELSAYYTSDKHSPNYDIPDISSSKKDWPNGDIARYYKIKSIRSNNQ